MDAKDTHIFGYRPDSYVKIADDTVRYDRDDFGTIAWKSKDETKFTIREDGIRIISGGLTTFKSYTELTVEDVKKYADAGLIESLAFESIYEREGSTASNYYMCLLKNNSSLMCYNTIKVWGVQPVSYYWNSESDSSIKTYQFLLDTYVIEERTSEPISNIDQYGVFYSAYRK